MELLRDAGLLVCVMLVSPTVNAESRLEVQVDYLADTTMETEGGMTLSKATAQSLQKLRSASLWMKFLPGEDKPAKDRAEQRGDTIMKRPDPTFTQGQAMMDYEFSGSPKAKDLATLIKKKGEESQRTMKKAGQSLKNSLSNSKEETRPRKRTRVLIRSNPNLPIDSRTASFRRRFRPA